jgi:hypothetical protein
LPFAIKKRPDGGLHVKYSGDVTASDLFAAQRAAYGKPPRVRKSVRFVFSDWSEVDSLDVSADQVRRAASNISALLKVNPSLTFVGALKTDLVYGLGRMAQSFVGEAGARIHLCRTVEEAEAWIKVNAGATRRAPA